MAESKYIVRKHIGMHEDYIETMWEMHYVESEDSFFADFLEDVMLHYMASEKSVAFEVMAMLEALDNTYTHYVMKRMGVNHFIEIEKVKIS